MGVWWELWEKHENDLEKHAPASEDDEDDNDEEETNASDDTTSTKT